MVIYYVNDKMRTLDVNLDLRERVNKTYTALFDDVEDVPVYVTETMEELQHEYFVTDTILWKIVYTDFLTDEQRTQISEQDFLINRLQDTNKRIQEDGLTNTFYCNFRRRVVTSEPDFGEIIQEAGHFYFSGVKYRTCGDRILAMNIDPEQNEFVNDEIQPAAETFNSTGVVPSSFPVLRDVVLDRINDRDYLQRHLDDNIIPNYRRVADEVIQTLGGLHQ